MSKRDTIKITAYDQTDLHIEREMDGQGTWVVSIYRGRVLVRSGVADTAEKSWHLFGVMAGEATAMMVRRLEADA